MLTGNESWATTCASTVRCCWKAELLIPRHGQERLSLTRMLQVPLAQQRPDSTSFCASFTLSLPQSSLSSVPSFLQLSESSEQPSPSTLGETGKNPTCLLACFLPANSNEDTHHTERHNITQRAHYLNQPAGVVRAVLIAWMTQCSHSAQLPMQLSGITKSCV